MRILRPPGAVGFTDQDETKPSNSGAQSPMLSVPQSSSREQSRYDSSSGNTGVRIPLRVMVSKGFEEDKHPEIIKTVWCGAWTLLSRVILTAALGSFLFGFNIALLNTCLNTISIDLHWCDAPGDTMCERATLLKSFTNTTVFIGGALGAMTGGRFVFVGRRMAVVLTMTVFLLGITSSVIADSFATLVWARLIVGYGVGVISVVVPIYMSEMSPSESRGFYCSFHQLFITLGIFIAVLLGLPLSLGPEESEKNTYVLPLFQKIWWRVMLGLGFIPVLLCMYLLVFVMKFETPHYYVENDHENEARKILRALQNTDDVEPALIAIVRARDDALEAQQNGLTFAKAMQQRLYRKVVIIGCLLASLQQLCGITIFISSSNDLFASAHLSPELITTTSTFLTFINFVMTIPAIYLIDFLGRRTLILFGTLGMGLSVLPATIFFWIQPNAQLTVWLSIAGSISFIFCFSATYGPVLWVYLFEIYPTEIKGVASGLATACNWIMGIAVVFFARFISVNITFTIFCAMSFLTTAFVYFFIKETKGRSLENSPYLD